MRYLQVLKQSSPARSVAVLVLDTDEAGAEEPTRDVAPIAFFEQVRGELTLDQQEHLLATLIQQIQPRIVHAFESEVAFGTFEVYGRVLKQNSALFASIGDIIEGTAGKRNCPIFGRHPDFFTSTTRIITADQRTAEELGEITGADARLFAAEPIEIDELPDYLPPPTQHHPKPGRA
jgi:hypothetical protein